MFNSWVFRIFVFYFYFFAVIEGSCISYGHSCWGAHGKRSFPPLKFVRSSSSSPEYEIFNDPTNEEEEIISKPSDSMENKYLDEVPFYYSKEQSSTKKHNPQFLYRMQNYKNGRITRKQNKKYGYPENILKVFQMSPKKTIFLRSQH